MSMTDGPIVPSKIGNDQLWLPTVSWPDLVLASVFASMSKPSDFFARADETARDCHRLAGSRGSAGPRGRFIWPISSKCALQDGPASRQPHTAAPLPRHGSL